MSILETILSHDTVVPIKKLADVTVEEDCGGIEVDLTNHTWNDHAFVLIHFTPAPENNAPNCNAFFNNGGSNCGTCYRLDDTSSSAINYLIVSDYGMYFSMLLHIGHKTNQVLNGIGWSYSGVYAITSNMSTQTLKKLTVGNTNGTPMKAGSRLEIIGIF